MKLINRKAGFFGAGLMVALACGAPALADDTELLLVNPNLQQAPKPNIMFILDSSGSMGSQEETREIYDSSETFAGTCDNDMLYWTEVDAVPSCDEDNERFFEKASFVCDAATRQLTGIGSYTNVMAQFRDGGSGFFSVILGLDKFRWQQLESGNASDMVECRKDSGVHGDGDPALVYAQAGGDVAPFTADPDDRVSWGSWPTSQTVTVYDGNYLNYLQNPVMVQRSRINIVRDVTKVVLNSVENINVGIMRFNNNAGGPVLLGMTDLDTNRAAVDAVLDSMNAGGATPLSEALYESARYWRGLPAYYGENINEHQTDPNALASDNPEVYKQPPSDVCSKNFNVLLTDGANTAGEVDPLKAAELAQQIGLRVYTIGIGAEQLEVSSLIGGRRQINPSADLDEATLTQIAEMTGGRYFRAKDTAALQDIYRLVDELEPVDEPESGFRPVRSLYHLPLAGAFACHGRRTSEPDSPQQAGQT